MALLIVGLLVLALIVVMGSRGKAEFERDEVRRELEGRKCAEEAGKPYNSDKPCGHSQCFYSLCRIHPAGSLALQPPRDPFCCYLNDGLNYYEDDGEEEKETSEEVQGSTESILERDSPEFRLELEELIRQGEELANEFAKVKAENLKAKKKIEDRLK